MENCARCILYVNDDWFRLDAPTRSSPTLGEVRHWLVVNIPGTDIDGGEELASFIPSGPYKHTGTHRYVFLAYQQLNGRQVFGEKPVETVQ